MQAPAGSAIPPEDPPRPRRECGPGQFPGSFPCRIARSQLRAAAAAAAAAGGRRHAGRVHENHHQTHDTRCRLFEANSSSALMHYGVVCDVCETTVRGRRFKCLTCEDYDLCDPCKAKGHHSSHNFKCIPFPIPAALVPIGVVVCDFCDVKITEEERHQCLECTNFDLCGECFSSLRELHPHQFRPNLPRYTSDAPAPDKAAEQASVVSESAVPSQEKPLVVHSHIWCDACDRVITGTRYKCGNCPDFDLCADCEAKADHDEDHVFLKIRRPIALRRLGAVLPPLYVPNACQGVRQTWENISHGAARDPRAEGLTENAPSVHHKETETAVPRTVDQATSTEKSTKAVATQTPQHGADSQGSDAPGATQQTACAATPSALLRASDARNQLEADSRAARSAVGGGADGAGEPGRQENVGVGASPALAFDAPGEAEVVPTPCTGCAGPDPPSRIPFLETRVPETRRRIGGGSGVCGQSEKAVADSGTAGPGDADPSISMADIEDEFIMVSPVEGVSKVATGRAESFTCEVNQGTPELLTGCLEASNRVFDGHSADADVKRM